MGPTARDWLGAGALALVLAVLVVLLVVASLPADGGGATALGGGATALGGPA